MAQRKATGLGITIVVCLAMAGTPTVATDNEWEIVPTIGARGGGSVDGENTVGTELDFGAVYGITINKKLRPDAAFEATWMHQETGVDVTDEDGVTSFFGIDVNALHFGAAYRPLPKSGKARKAHPFVATTIGLSVYDAETAGFGSGTVFSLALSGGWTVPVSDHIGFRFTGRAWLVFQDYAFSGSCGGTGCTSRVIIRGGFQFEATAGLVFGF